MIPLDAKVLKFQKGSVKDCQEISHCIGYVFVERLSPFGNPTARFFFGACHLLSTEVVVARKGKTTTVYSCSQ